MVQELDTHAETKFSRARVSARLNDPKLEADLYPVGSWRDRPPTGVKVDLSEPQPQPAPTRKTTTMKTMTKTLKPVARPPVRRFRQHCS